MAGCAPQAERREGIIRKLRFSLAWASRFLAIPALWGLAAASVAQPSDGATGVRVLAEPTAAGWTAWGAGETNTFRADGAVRGGTAFRVSIAAPGAHPWDAGAAVPNTTDAQKGDTVVAAFWARSANPGANPGPGHLLAAIQAAQAPYATAAQAGFELGPDWRLYQLRGALPFAAAPGQLELTVQLAEKAQAVELGPAYLLDAEAGTPPPSPDDVARLTGRLPITEAAEDATIDVAGGKIKLAATLRKPAGPGPYPVVIFFAGHGPWGRVNGSAAINRALLARGVAVLSYDKRGVGASTGSLTDTSLFDLIDDAATVVAWAKHRPDIDPARITLMGGSEGAVIAPAVAVREPVGFLVVHGTLGQSLARANLARLGATPQPPAGSIEAKQMAVSKEVIAALADAHDPAEACKRAKAYLGREEVKALVTDAQYAQAMSSFCNPQFLRVYLYDPGEALRKIRIPTLVVSGSLDAQVPPDVNLPLIRAAMADNPDLTVLEFPGLNHLLRYAKTGSVEEWTAPGAPSDDAQEAVDVIADWVARHAFGPGPRPASGR